MADSDDTEDYSHFVEKEGARIMDDALDDPQTLAFNVTQLSRHWAYFELTVIKPILDPVFPPAIIKPKGSQEEGEYEFVYSILDYNFKLLTSKAEDMFTSGMSMAKLYNTIEKMVFILVERLKEGGADKDTEIQVAFEGFESAKRKAFEIIINLSFNVVVTNFDPGEWGELYLEIVKGLAKANYGYPPEAPRDVFMRIAGGKPKFSH